MTYLEFLLLFICPPLVLAALLWRRTRHTDAGVVRPYVALPAICFVALIYTTPWDNYLVWRGVWMYGPDRVLGTIGYVPVEEYLFFILQPLLTGCWFYAVTTRLGGAAADAGARTAHRLGSIVFLVLSAAGVGLLRTDDTLYLGLILAWATPVLALQWVLAGDQFWRRRRAMVPAVLAPTVYLWIADRIAIGAEIWTLSGVYTTGLHVLGLPLEEALFFFVTNLLVVQGLVLFVAPPHCLARWASARDAMQPG